jgi:hypothetical protein
MPQSSTTSSPIYQFPKSKPPKQNETTKQKTPMRKANKKPVRHLCPPPTLPPNPQNNSEKKNLKKKKKKKKKRPFYKESHTNT